jgi:hemerythrin-like metal-binding protein
MGLIEWTPALSVGIPTIDEQHKVLVGLINRLGEAAEAGRTKAEIGPVLLELEDYTKKHFSLEEAAFEEYAYPDAAKHIAEHEAFVAKIDDFQMAFAVDKAQVGEEILLYLRTWLTRHITFTDKKYRPYLAGKI